MRMGRQEAKEWISKACGKGWLKLVDDVYDKLPEGIEIIQAYQKWAGLNFDTTEHENLDMISLCEIDLQQGDYLKVLTPCLTME